MLEPRLLLTFREVALRRSFSNAAEALALTQPAVSQQIARLEKQVGVKLIEREPRGIRLTPAGDVLVHLPVVGVVHREERFASLLH